MQQEKREIILLNAVKDILEKCKESNYVLDVMGETSYYDGTDCDGDCLLEDINDFLDKS